MAGRWVTYLKILDGHILSLPLEEEEAWEQVQQRQRVSLRVIKRM